MGTQKWIKLIFLTMLTQSFDAQWPICYEGRVDLINIRTSASAKLKLLFNEHKFISFSQVPLPPLLINEIAIIKGNFFIVLDCNAWIQNAFNSQKLISRRILHEIDRQQSIFWLIIHVWLPELNLIFSKLQRSKFL